MPITTTSLQEAELLIKLIAIATLATSLSACATEGAVREAVIDRVVHSSDGKAACQCTAVCQQ